LQSAFDAIVARFDALRHPDPQTGGMLQFAPESEPVPVNLAADVGDQPVDEAAQAAEAPASHGLGPRFVAPVAPAQLAARSGAAVRVRPELLDRLVNQAGEVIISRSRMEAEVLTLRTALKDLTGNLDRLRQQLRDIELQAETQMQSRLAQARDADQSFDPLEFEDRKSTRL